MPADAPQNSTITVKSLTRKEKSTRRNHRLMHTNILTEVLGNTKKQGTHCYQQTTIRLNDITKNKLLEMARAIDVNQSDIVVFALNQLYTLFQDTATVSKIQQIIVVKVRPKSKDNKKS
jgi:hypothetical protein